MHTPEEPPPATHATAFGVQVALLIGHLTIAYHVLTYVLAVEEQVARFTWIGSPTYHPMKPMLGVLPAIVLFVVTARALCLYPRRLPDEHGERPGWLLTRIFTLAAWLSVLLLGGIHLATTAPVESYDAYDAEVLEVLTPPRQSKPILHHMKVTSWRGDGTETLTTRSWAAATRLKEARRVQIHVGKDWVGSIRVVGVHPSEK